MTGRIFPPLNIETTAPNRSRDREGAVLAVLLASTQHGLTPFEIKRSHYSATPHQRHTNNSKAFAAATVESRSTYSSAACVLPPQTPHSTAGILNSWNTNMSHGPSMPTTGGGSDKTW